MDKIKIKWEASNYGNLLDANDCNFYAFSRGTNLLYIGIVYSQEVQDEVRNTLNRLKIKSTQGLSIWLGYIESSSYKRITVQIVKDSESLMIYTNQPKINIQCKENYTGRDNFKVKTSGNPLIRRCVPKQNGRVYWTC